MLIVSPAATAIAVPVLVHDVAPALTVQARAVAAPLRNSVNVTDPLVKGSMTPKIVAT